MLDQRDPSAKDHGVGRTCRVSERVDVQGIDADQRRADVDQVPRGRLRQERVVREVGLRAPMGVPARRDERRPPGDAQALERLGTDGLLGSTATVQENAVEIRYPLQLEPGEVGPPGEPVGRHVQVRPRVRDQVDPPDLERRAGRIAADGRLVREEGRDDRSRDAGVRDHAVDYWVAEIDRTASDGSLHGRMLPSNPAVGRSFSRRPCAVARAHPSAAGTDGSSSERRRRNSRPAPAAASTAEMRNVGA